MTVLQNLHKGPRRHETPGLLRRIPNTSRSWMPMICAGRTDSSLNFRNSKTRSWIFVASSLSFIDAQGRPIPGLWTCPPNAPRNYWASLIERNWTGTPSVVLRRSILESTGVFDEEFTHAEDYDLWLRVGRSQRSGFIDEPLIQCRRHSANTSIDIESHQHFERKALQKVDAGEAYEAFGRLYADAHERDEAWIGFLLRSANSRFLDEAHDALARNPRSSAVRFALGVFHYDSGQYEIARATFLGIPQQDAASIHNAGVTSALCGDVASAKLRLSDALRIRPEYYDARYNLDALNDGKRLRLTRRPLRTNPVPNCSGGLSQSSTPH
jgi:tetratricopeptide (TPR) repeat protein